jgi:hypothetical protein
VLNGGSRKRVVEQVVDLENISTGGRVRYGFGP